MIGGTGEEAEDLGSVLSGVLGGQPITVSRTERKLWKTNLEFKDQLHAGGIRCNSHIFKSDQIHTSVSVVFFLFKCFFSLFYKFHLKE